MVMEASKRSDTNRKRVKILIIGSPFNSPAGKRKNSIKVEMGNGVQTQEEKCERLFQIITLRSMDKI